MQQVIMGSLDLRTDLLENHQLQLQILNNTSKGYWNNNIQSLQHFHSGFTLTRYEILHATVHFFVFAVVTKMCLSLLCEQSLPICCNGNACVRIA
jgi:hypothetical protein